jgi:bacillithiol system protein YtxJ
MEGHNSNMLKWFTGTGAEHDTPVFDKARVGAQDLAVVFKHSTTCPISFAADREMRAFIASHPQVPVHKVLVREQRATSNDIADWTGIEHESPQVIVLRNGKVVASASHGEITEDYLDDVTKN